MDDTKLMPDVIYAIAYKHPKSDDINIIAAYETKVRGSVKYIRADICTSETDTQAQDRSSMTERAAHNSRGCGFDSRRSYQDDEITALDAEIARGTQRDIADKEDAQNADR